MVPFKAETYYQFIDNVQSRDHLWLLMKDVFSQLGFPSFSYQFVPFLQSHNHRKAKLYSSSQAGWQKECNNKKLFLKSPIVQCVIDLGRPFYWSELGRHIQLSDSQREHLEERAKSGVSPHGLTIPVTNTCGNAGFIGIDLEASSDRITFSQLSQIYHISQISHAKYCSILNFEDTTRVTLSKRENSILQLIAFGRTNGEIAVLLGLSKHTIDSYLRRIFLKFGTNDRVSTVRTAIVQRHIL